MGRKLTIRDMVLFIFMPVLLAAVLLCGGISYFLIRRQIQDNTFSNALDIVTQLQMNLDYRLGDLCFRPLCQIGQEAYHTYISIGSRPSI